MRRRSLTLLRAYWSVPTTSIFAHLRGQVDEAEVSRKKLLVATTPRNKITLLRRTNIREIIILREYEDLSYQEIAAMLDCPAGTVMSRLARARSRLRVLLSVNERSLQRNESPKAKGCSQDE